MGYRKEMGKGGEILNFFHGILIRKGLIVRFVVFSLRALGVTYPSIVRKAFKNHFESWIFSNRVMIVSLNASFHNRIIFGSGDELDRAVSKGPKFNLHNIVKVLNCFHLASGLKINIAKSQVLGVGVSQNVVVQAANRIGCAVLNTPFRYSWV
ncbi:hypothetical protein Tco_0671794 [Tanacetum coccineum]